MNKNSNKFGHFAALFTVLIWGTTFIATKVLLDYMTPIDILFVRFLIGYIALCLLSRKRTKVIAKSHELLFMGAGLCGVTLYFLCENIALNITLATNVGVIVSIAPIFTAILAHFFLQENSLKPSFFIGFVTAIAGIILISYTSATKLQLNPIGDLLSVLAAFLWGGYSILSKKIANLGYDTLGATRKIFFYGVLFMLPAILIVPSKLTIDYLHNPMLVANILFLGLGASALCYITWNLATKYLGAVKVSVYIYIIPVVTLSTSALVLHEKVGILAIAGTSLTILGLIVSEYNPKKQQHN